MKMQPVSNGLYDEFLRDLSENNAIGCLLNCYIREYALFRGEVTCAELMADCPLALRFAAVAGSQLVAIDFAESRARLLIRADRVSELSRCRFITKPYLKTPGKPWRAMQAEELCRFIVKHLALIEGGNFNEEFIEQVVNSIDVTRQFLHHRADKARNDDSFIDSEQSLIWGHAMHPTPKSRHGVRMAELLNCSPEIAASFQLYWFSVDRSLVCQQGADGFNVRALFTAVHGEQTQQPSMMLYPCHPWEVTHIMRNPLVQRAIERGVIVPEGYLGLEMIPTSSVRTLYHPELAAQIKLSIHVRLTNCIRKNAWYELESAVLLSALIKQAGAPINRQCPEFKVMLEPAATSIDLSSLQAHAEPQQVRDCREYFGILYRDTIAAADRQAYQPVLAASLFSWDREGSSVIETTLRTACDISNTSNTSYAQHAEHWFADYAAPLLAGVFGYFFRLGIVFEPHLQNTLIGFTDGLPSCVWIRDLEGTKLLRPHWPADTLAGLSERARSSVYYSREQGWNRIAYCLLINNFSEAIFHLSAGDKELESQLWQTLHQLVEDWQQRHGSEPELQHLLDGAAIPCKTNFITRLHSKPDRCSSYIPLSNPMQPKPMQPKPMQANSMQTERASYDIAS